MVNSLLSHQEFKKLQAQWLSDAGDLMQRDDVQKCANVVEQIRDTYFQKIAPKKPYLELLRLQYMPSMQIDVVPGLHARLAEIDKTLVDYNTESLALLMATGALTELQAKKLQGSIIKCCISAFQKVSGLERGEGVRVPRLIPEGSGKLR